MSGRHSIFIVEDHAVYRMGLRELIKQEEDLLVCGEADSAREAWEGIKRLAPDMVILDLSLKDGSGMPLIKDLVRMRPAVAVLVLSMYDESLYAERSIAAGARGYLMKQEAADSIIRAVRHILAGNIYVSERVTGSLLHRLARGPEARDRSPIETLTDRELEVFRLMGSGQKAGEIARTMNLSVRTVGTYRERIKEKLGVKSAADLIKRAALWIDENQGPAAE